MIRTVLTFTLLAPKKLSGSKEKKWDNDKAGALKDIGATLIESGNWRIELRRERLSEVVKYLESLRKEKARVNGFEVSEELVDDDKTPVEWFMADPHYSGALESLWWDLQEPIAEDEQHL